MKVGNVEVGYGQPTFVIAEACSNIMRWLDPHALDAFVKSVSQTGATSLKIQLFKAEHFPESEWESKKKVEFPRARLGEFAGLCHEYKLLWGASVFDDEAVNLLVQHGADYIKVATREQENHTLYQKVLESGLPIFASYDCTKGGMTPYIRGGINLACVPKYPTIDPRVIEPYDYDDKWGWSSHLGTPDSLDCLIAVARGACVVERHIMFSHADYEAGWSLDPTDFRKMVENIRRVERMR